MRKIIVSLIASLAIISCQRSEGGNDLQDLKEITKADVSFVNYSKLLKERSLTSRMEVDGGGVGFEFTLGRKSRDCRGFGVCELTAFWIEIYGKKTSKTNSESRFTGVIAKDRSLNISGKSSESQYGAFLILETEIDGNVFDTNFYVDNDINVDDKFVVKKGVYKLDKTLGKNGGYKLETIKL